MDTIKVDFIEVEHHLFGPDTFIRVQFEENYSFPFLPQNGDLIVIGNGKYKVEQLVYFPFGDTDGQIGVTVYLNYLGKI